MKKLEKSKHFDRIMRLIGLGSLVGGLIALGFAKQHDETLIVYAFFCDGSWLCGDHSFSRISEVIPSLFAFQKEPNEKAGSISKAGSIKSWIYLESSISVKIVHSVISIYDAVIFNNFICLGQVLIFGIHESAYNVLGYSYMFQIFGGGFGILAMFFILLSLIPCVKIRLRREGRFLCLYLYPEVSLLVL